MYQEAQIYVQFSETSPLCPQKVRIWEQTAII